MTATAWLDSLSPWPRDGFGLERMRALLAELGDPQESYPAIHVVGTNGKSTATVTIEQLLLIEGVSVGSTISPHVAGWSERIRVNGEEADFEESVGRVRAAAERLGATQFEIVTAAALSAFAEASVDAAVVEAGLGGRLDATNVLRTRVVLLTNVGLDHTDVLGETRDEIAREKLAVAREDSVVVLPDSEFAHLVPGRRIVVGGAREAAEAFLGRLIDAEVEVTIPGRFERREGEIRDGAHNPDGVRYLVERLRGSEPQGSSDARFRDVQRVQPEAETARGSEPQGRTGRRWTGADFTIVASILEDKDADTMLRELRRAGSRLVATRSSSTRSLPAATLAERARRYFDHVEEIDDPVEALARGHELGEPVLVTGSLYLLGDLAEAERRTTWPG